MLESQKAHHSTWKSLLHSKASANMTILFHLKPTSIHNKIHNEILDLCLRGILLVLVLELVLQLQSWCAHKR